MDGITVLRITEFYNESTMDEDIVITDFEIGSEQQNDIGDYPDGFVPSLYDL